MAGVAARPTTRQPLWTILNGCRVTAWLRDSPANPATEGAAGRPGDPPSQRPLVRGYWGTFATSASKFS